MAEETFFTTSEIAQQLGVGVSTVKVWIKRYSKWLLSDAKNENGIYSKETFETFRIIAECTSSGMDLATIELMLDDTTKPLNQVENDGRHKSDSQAADIGETRSTLNNPIVDAIGTGGLDNILLQILDQQKKIASAQERRASAEERKAYALESRTEAELLKANVMQEMLAVFKDNSLQPTVSSLMDRIQRMPGPSPSGLESLSPDLDYDFPDNFNDLPELTESIPEQPQMPAPPTDVIIEEQAEQETSQDDTDSQLDESALEPDDDMDAISLLVEGINVEPAEDMDDLSLLVEGATIEPVEDMDDLSLLIEGVTVEPVEDMDDLSLLIEGISGEPLDDMDDLSLLIEGITVEPIDDMDDLSLLIDPPALSAKEAPPAKTPTAGEHKSQVLSKIINMKEKEGLSIEDTTKRLNDEGIKTLSGKGQWDTKTITGIYQYIDSGKGKK